jgi:hypothetical protein
MYEDLLRRTHQNCIRDNPELFNPLFPLPSHTKIALALSISTATLSATGAAVLQSNIGVAVSSSVIGGATLGVFLRTLSGDDRNPLYIVPALAALPSSPIVGSTLINLMIRGATPSDAALKNRGTELIVGSVTWVGVFTALAILAGIGLLIERRLTESVTGEDTTDIINAHKTTTQDQIMEEGRSISTVATSKDPDAISASALIEIARVEKGASKKPNYTNSQHQDGPASP